MPVISPALEQTISNLRQQLNQQLEGSNVEGNLLEGNLLEGNILNGSLLEGNILDGNEGPLLTPQFLSISVKIERVDLLRVWQGLAATHLSLFYLENQQRQGAGLGFDRLHHHTYQGEQRFTLAQAFIQDCLDHTLTLGAMDLPLSGPHFFCNFTFMANGAPQVWHNTCFPDATIVLPRWQIMQSAHHCLFVANVKLGTNPLAIHQQVQGIVQQIEQDIEQIYRLNDLPVPPPSRLSDKKSTQAKKSTQENYVIPVEQFKAGIAQAVQTITSQNLEKIVLANAIDLQAPQPFQVASILRNLRQAYPDCSIFATCFGQGATFLGASPEVVLRTEKGHLWTEAIAGSAPRGTTEVGDVELANRLLQGPKERHEHQVVVDFILDCLGDLGLVPQTSNGPLLRQLTNIQHLWTPIEAPLPPSIHPLEVLAQLYPTPAVAGFPRNLALGQLQGYEPFDRLLYAAPLGWVGNQGNSEFVVGIRSALIQDNLARLYAGVGIVAGSDPDLEFAEVQLKLRALLDVLV
jgi:menaquinone-specific isochorismate synthase